jgi:hypothetical protein
MNPVDSGRIIRSYTQHVEAAPEEVFPLCPVREADWVDGWVDEVEIVHSDSGFARNGCVFRTRRPGQPETIWAITRHDATQKVVEFLRVTTGLVATRSLLFEDVTIKNPSGEIPKPPVARSPLADLVRGDSGKD